jgi:hypothetical protein
VEKFQNALLYRGFHCDNNGNKIITVNGTQLKGYWVIGYLQLTKSMAFITPYNVDVTYVTTQSTLISPALEVVVDTVSMCTSIYDDQDRPVLIFQNDTVIYNDGFHCFKGRVCFEGGAFGIACDYTIPIESSSDNFISFYEMIFNQEVWDNFNHVDNVTITGTIWEDENA